MSIRARMNILHTFNILIIIIIQTTVLDYFKIKGIKPNMIFTYTVCTSILEGSTPGAVIGLAAGMALDIVSGKVLGFYSLLGMYAGIIAGLASRKLYKDNILVVTTFTFFITFIYETVALLCTGFSGFSVAKLLSIFRTVILPTALYNSALSIIMHLLLLKTVEKLNLKASTKKRR